MWVELSLSEWNGFLLCADTCIESFRSTSLGTSLKCCGSLENASDSDWKAGVYMYIVFSTMLLIISMKQMFLPKFQFSLVVYSCQADIVYALFYFLIDERSRDHYRELGNKILNLMKTI